MNRWDRNGTCYDHSVYGCSQCISLDSREALDAGEKPAVVLEGAAVQILAALIVANPTIEPDELTDRAIYAAVQLRKKARLAAKDYA